MKFEKLRKFTKTIMWVVAILIVPSFVIWNIGSAVRERRSGYAGKLFNKNITWNTYQKAKRAARNEAWMRFGDKLDQSVNLEEQTWTRLILASEAKKRKITISNEELLDYIKNLPTFRFMELNPQNYSLIVAKLFQETPGEFEEGIRDSILMKKLIEQVAADVVITDNEIKDAYFKDNQQAKVSYLIVEPKKFLNSVPAPAEEALKSYYQEHHAEFKKPEQVIVSYLEIKLESFKKDIEITEDRISKYYENNKDKFKQEEKEPAADKAKETSFKPLAEVKESIKEILIEKEMENRASDVARKIMSKLYTDADLAKVAQEFGQTAQTTGPFSMLEEIPNVGLNFPFLKAAFSLKSGEISEIIKSPTAYYILKPIKKIQPHVPPFEEVIDKVKDNYLEAEAEKLAKQETENTLAKIKELMAKESLNFEEATTKLSLSLKIAENFTRKGYINELGYAPDFTQAAFSLKPQEISTVVGTPRGFCILKQELVLPVTEEQFEKDKTSYKEKVLSEKKNKYLIDWFIALKQKANPVNYLEENKQK